MHNTLLTFQTGVLCLIVTAAALQDEFLAFQAARLVCGQQEAGQPVQQNV